MEESHHAAMPSTGHTVLHYELGDKLGAGGMGEVFRARDTRLGREVALKFIAPQYREDADRRARLLKEAQAASALRSPAIATTYDQEPPAIARLNYDVPVRLQDIVRKLLAKSVSERYQTARDLLIDVKSLQKDLEIDTQTGSAERPTPTLAPAAATRTVAVLPFANITREPTDDWIGSGIAETVTADLKTIRGLTVLGRERIFDALRNLGSSDSGNLDERVSFDVGRQLRATWLISGGYQRLGDLIRITARGVDVESGTVVRTVKIDGQISDIFTLQDKIVYELSKGIDLTLNASEVAAIEHQETASVEAYEARSRAMMNLMEGTPQALDRAIHLLEQATERDPNYAAAWAALGAAYDFKGQFQSLPHLSLKAVEMGRRAIDIDPKLADAHRWLGLSLISIASYDEAIAAIQEAARLEPDDANVYSSLGRAYWVGKGDLDAGIAHLERAAEINPDLGYAHLQLGLLYALRGNYPKAEAACRRAIDLQERLVSGREGLQIVGAYTRLGYVQYLRGEYQDALHVFHQQVEALSGSDHALKERSLIELDCKIGATYLRMGQHEDAERHFTRAMKSFEDRLARGADDPFTKYYIAGLCGLRGDIDHAVRYFEETLGQLPALNRTRARLDPDFEAVRADPRMSVLLAADSTQTASGSEASPGGVVS